MLLIILLFLLGITLLLAELVLLPGVTVAGIGALFAMGGAITYGYLLYGPLVGSLILVGAIVVSILLIVISLRSKTWQRFSLKSTIESTSLRTPQEQNVEIGAQGIAISRLGPIGNIQIGELILEARAQNSYIDPQERVEVVGFDNTVAVVRKLS